ncbi:hypothetical protein Ahy_B03g061742 [Arachis hypogaea]|uniref:Uncharacterized protein n=1 Tax=Arachis hypogaea TaxID=3818 RepID=A0A444ZRQ5_ARAHY|nr:hypothetical protein Ahy_B03g061742 [Arachis hypogaea]
MEKKGCWETCRYNGRHTYTMEAISQDYSKLDSDTVAEAIRPLVETDPSIKRIEANMQHAGNIVVHRFDKQNEVFEVREMTSGKLYVHDVYKMTEVRKVYRFEFTPLGNPKTCPAYAGSTLVATPTLRRTSKGHPNLTQYLNKMDSRDMRGPRICCLCGDQG